MARLWATKGSKPQIASAPSSKPQIASAPSRKSVAISGYVFPESGKLIVTKPTWFNFETVIQSLREFISVVNIPFNTKIALVLDNAPWHKKAYRLIVEEELPEYADIRQKIELIRLPPYSPDLNPIEQCWRKARREVTHNRYFKSLELPEYADIRQKIELIRLPPYSPDLNPIEQCWRKARREVTHNRYFKSLDDLAYSLFS